MSAKLSENNLNAALASVEIGGQVLAKIVEGHAAAQAELDKRAEELKPEVVEHLRDETRKKFAEKADAAFERHIAKSKHIPAEQKPLYDAAQLRRNSRFHSDDATDAQMTTAFLGRLAIAPPRRLAELAEDVAERGDFAAAGVLSDFVESRSEAVPHDVRGAVEEALGEMKYAGREVEQLDELEGLIFEAQQLVSDVKIGARRYRPEELEAMDQPTFEAARDAQRKAGIRQ